AFSPEAGRFLGPSLKAFDVDQTIDWFESAGLCTKIEANGKIFPASDRATDVLAVLLRATEKAGVRLLTNQPVISVDRSGSVAGFVVKTPTDSFRAARVIMATGGRSFPGSGTTGDGYAMAAGFGHSIIPPRPALVPVRVQANWVNELKGLTLPDVLVKVLDADKKLVDQRREAVLFAHFGLTGPAILDISRLPARASELAGWSLELDLVPDRRPDQVEEEMIARSRQGRISVLRLLPEELPGRLKEHLLEELAIPQGMAGAELSKEKRRGLVAALKGLKMPLAGTLGFEKAEVTSGGVALAEVDSKTLESRFCPGLYLIGEVLDIDGRIGGYNFQAAWSMGRLVGSSIKI
ncbi:MAG: NAD(P)/FAD-dependent oxidoreductase, partial [bacterium]